MEKEAKAAKKLLADILAVKCTRTLPDVFGFDVFGFMRKRQQERYPSCSREAMIRMGQSVGRMAMTGKMELNSMRESFGTAPLVLGVGGSLIVCLSRRVPPDAPQLYTSCLLGV